MDGESGYGDSEYWQWTPELRELYRRNRKQFRSQEDFIAWQKAMKETRLKLYGDEPVSDEEALDILG